MRSFRPALFLLLLPILTIDPHLGRAETVTSSPTPPIPTGGEIAAQSAAEVWLAIADDSRYEDCYKAAAGIFQQRISQDDWVKKVAAGRGPLGKLVSRKHRSSKFFSTLPGAPDGQYVVVQYDASFEKKAAAVETVTMTVDTDGQWKVCGYFIR